MSRQWRSDDTDKWKYGFGSGKDGSTYAVPANAGCSGTSGGTSLTLDAASSFANGDLVLIHQTRGTGAENWELNKIASGGGTTSITLAHNLQNTYTDSGASQAQIIELKEYDSLVLSGTITVPSWDGNKGGIIAWLDKGTTSGTGTLSLSGGNGSPGSSGNPAGGTSGGFWGGRGFFGTTTVAESGEGIHGARSQSTNPSGNAGGGGRGGSSSTGTGSGGGGGNGTAGTNGTNAGSNTLPGIGGSTSGNAELTLMGLGAGGGGGARGGTGTNEIAGGGAGGGMLFVFAKNIDFSSMTAINLNGGISSGAWWTGGGGAGGSCLLKCQTAILGTNKITATGGVPTSLGSSPGGPGGAGRIHIDYSGSYTGTTTPTLNARKDSTIKAASATGNFFGFFKDYKVLDLSYLKWNPSM